MYDIKLINNISAKNIVNNEYIPEGQYATFFSGGLDSLATLINNMLKKTILITILDADVKCDSYEYWDKIKKEVSKFGNDRNFKNLFIKSEFREFINENELNKLSMDVIGDYWWHGVQHRIDLLGYIELNSYI